MKINKKEFEAKIKNLQNRIEKMKGFAIDYQEKVNELGEKLKNLSNAKT